MASDERRMTTPSLVDLNERLPQGNVWQYRGRPKSLIPRVAVPMWDTPSYTREWDLTFSLGRETTEYEVLRLLLNSGCIDDTNIHEMIRGIVVGDNCYVSDFTASVIYLVSYFINYVGLFSTSGVQVVNNKMQSVNQLVS